MTFQTSRLGWYAMDTIMSLCEIFTPCWCIDKLLLFRNVAEIHFTDVLLVTVFFLAGDLPFLFDPGESQEFCPTCNAHLSSLSIHWYVKNITK